ncbi:MAG: 1-deoxy-D-xylulose-5-phosphate synthase [Clostridia bacterium]|nr:1-deoxy-D-xylulose-5-phosphate synthase [Clostridia bacterium]
MKKSLLDCKFPEALKTMTDTELELLCYEIRSFLIEKVAKTGGHLASNLGVVELAVALHRVFDSPKDKIIWDVGHQAYVHKILTGRADKFDSLRQLDGISGFPKSEESEHDVYNTGHSSTSISAASGFAAARDLTGDDYNVVAVIGDGALTGGLAYEALNNIGDSNSRMIVLLNDNGMSISANTGSVSKHLRRLRMSKKYIDFKKQVKKTIKGIPSVGEGIFQGIEHIRDTVKFAIVDGAIFEALGFKYIGPINGHDVFDVMEALQLAKDFDGPVLIHAITEKGKGYKNAEINPNKFHGIGPFNPMTGAELKPASITYSKIFSKKLIQLAEKNPKIVAVCAAMTDGTGLDKFAARYPDRTFDVGIAEAHAVTFAAGMARGGLHPVVAVYSAFLQRAYDNIIEDVCLQKLPVVFAIDRAGIVGNDGETHHGLFDLSYLLHIPGLTVLAPKDGAELAAMLEYAFSLDAPCAIRYPRGSSPDFSSSEAFESFASLSNYDNYGTFGTFGTFGNSESDGKPPVFEPGKAQQLIEGTDAEIWAVGKMVETGIEAVRILKSHGYRAGLVNVASLKPFDEEKFLKAADNYKKIITLEDNVAEGGFGEKIAALLQKHSKTKTGLLALAWPDRFIEHGAGDLLFERYRLDPEGVAERIREFIERKA